MTPPPKTLLVTFVYEQALPFLPDLFASIAGQSASHFDTLIIDYGISINLSHFDYFGMSFKKKTDLNQIADRDWILNYALDLGYELLVLLDADDTMSPDRIKVTQQAFDSPFSFFYTKLYLLNSKNQDFFAGTLPPTINSLNQIIDGNCIGFSHIAINLKKCHSVIRQLNTPTSVIAYDWFFATLLLENGHQGCRLDTKTYYRIHDHNTAGFTDNLTEDMLRRTFCVKSNHYEALAGANTKNKKLFLRKSTEIRELRAFTQRREGIQKLLTELKTKRNLENKFWWTIITT